MGTLCAMRYASIPGMHNAQQQYRHTMVYSSRGTGVHIIP